MKSPTGTKLLLLLTTASVVSAQISVAGERLERSLFHLNMQLSPGTTACTGASPGDSKPDLDDCTKFYFCSAVNVSTPDFSLFCGDGFKCFDGVSGLCSNDAAACQTACTTNGPQCKDTCTIIGEQYADPTDCNKHYICDANLHPLELHCFDDKPFFNGLDCVADEAQCCNCRKHTCEGATTGDLIVDPDDCLSFYACIEVSTGVFIQPGPTRCPDGQGFNPDKSECDPNNKECDNSCNIGGGGDTTTSAQSTATSDISTSASSLSTSASSLSTSASSLSTSASSLSTSASTLSTSTAPTTTPGCLDTSDFTCPGHGFYARCPFCDPSYFSCAGVGGSPTQGECSGNLVYNPNPEYPFCILPENCPI